MSFPIRKIGMLKMPKIAMLSTKDDTMRTYPDIVADADRSCFERVLPDYR